MIAHAMSQVEDPRNPSAISVVYVEDDVRLARLTTQYLASHGMVVHQASRGDTALAEVLRHRPDAILLDLMLPAVDGLEVCRRIREHVDTPILMLTARHEEADKVMGLEGGADDYIVKPYQSRELVARIRAHVRRARGRSGPRSAVVEVGPLRIDATAMSASLRGEALSLTTYELQLLRVLAERAGRVLSREQLLELTQGTTEDAFDRSIDVHVSRLRQKLGDDSKRPRLLKTVRGVGYVLSPEES